MIELLVCLAIISILTGVMLAQYKSFNSTILLRDLAYEIALATREAQVRAVSAQGSGDLLHPFGFNYKVGMHFELGTTYVLFTDINADNTYESGEEISIYTIGQRNQITALCSSSNCPPSAITKLDVLFKRPDPDIPFFDSTDGTAVPLVGVTSVSVVLGAPPDSNRRTVRIWSTGQIAVE